MKLKWSCPKCESYNINWSHYCEEIAFCECGKVPRELFTKDFMQKVYKDTVETLTLTEAFYQEVTQRFNMFTELDLVEMQTSNLKLFIDIYRQNIKIQKLVDEIKLLSEDKETPQQKLAKFFENGMKKNDIR